ncbi:TolC family protein [bacterium]|nr:TolC family protein [bacterium]
MINLKILIILMSLLLFNTPQTYAQKAKETSDYKLEYLNLKWWENFEDNILNEYLIALYNNNQDLKIATLKTKQSKEIVKQAFANQLPQLYFNGNIQREISSSTLKMGEVTIPDYNQARYLLPLTMSYEVDIWGENYLKTKSMKKQTEMAKEDERAVYISVTSNFVSDYYTLICLDKLIKNQKELLELESQIVQMEEAKYNSGLSSIAELLTEKQALLKIEERYNSLLEKEDLIRNQLIVQLGDRYNNKIQRKNYDEIPSIRLPHEISTEAIQYRPDIKKSELYLEKAGIDVKIARRDFFPKFTIYGQAGFNAYDWCKIFAPHTFMSAIGVAPSLDLFTGGYKKSKLRYNKLEYEKAKQIYDKTILTSIQELNDAMMSINIANSNIQKSEQRFNIEKEKLELANNQFTIGAKSKLENLKDQQTLLIIEEDLVMNKINAIIASINLYKAIGGRDYTEAL